MVFATCIPYALAVICFYIAGKHYVEFKKCLYYCKTATLQNIDINDFMDIKVLERTNSMVKIKRSFICKSFQF